MKEQLASPSLDEHLAEAIARGEDGGQQHNDRDATGCPTISVADTAAKSNRGEAHCAGRGR